MKVKRLLSLGIAGMLAFTAIGCGQGKSTNQPTEESASSESSESQKNTTEEYTKVVYSYWTMDPIPSEEARKSVEEAINEITREKIGVEVELMPLAASEQAQKVSLAMASGEQLDIFNTVGDLNTYITNNQVYDITDLVHQYAQGAVDQVSEEF